MTSAMLVAAAPLVLGASTEAPPLPWGSLGHEMAARAATEILPADMPAFFRDASDQLVYLAPEPDRWRGRPVEMNEAWQYDHYIDLENVPDGALDAPDRFAYLRMLTEAGLANAVRDGGFLHYRIVEMYERIVTEWRLWRAEADPARRRWIEQRIVNDAGILGHYVTDGSQPQHTTIHFDGWAAGAPNPNGYTSGRGFHSRFESRYVDGRVTQADVSSRTPAAPRSVAGRARDEVWRYLEQTHATLDELYRLDRDVGFDPDGPLRPEARDFTAERLAAGSTMLATLWWSAWLEGATGPS